jgi:cytochrome c peroxidase
VAAALAAAGCDEPSRTAAPARIEPRRAAFGREPLSPLPEPPTLDAALVELGRRLFHDKRLSVDDTIACASCHDLAMGGADANANAEQGRARSVGVGGKVGDVNAPSVYNAGLNIAQFWDGRAPTLEAQIDGPITSPLEMAFTWEGVIAKLKRDPETVAAFRRARREGMTPDDVRAAIAAFERTLLTRGSPFDRWLGGDVTALTPQQKAGYQTFKSVGCIACHQGSNVGGNMFQRFGVLGDYFNDRGGITKADYGRFNVTHDEADRFVFRVPSLRNVEHTAPYFHDGSAKTLTEAVQVMARYQLFRQLSDEEVAEIVAFLRSLSGPTAALGGGRASP